MNLRQRRRESKHRSEARPGAYDIAGEWKIF
jgi:hypothetical protein